MNTYFKNLENIIEIGIKFKNQNANFNNVFLNIFIFSIAS